MRELLASFLGAAALIAFAGCDTDAPIATEDGGTDAAVCMIECAAPPNGCRYEGGDGCSTCGTLVCDDAGTDGGTIDDAGSSDGGTCVECPAPPDGCRYDGGDCTTCGTLVCDGVVCSAGSDDVFPAFDRGCTDVADCVVVEHQTDCCGTVRALGIRADQQGTFDDAEARCRGMYPGCGCAGGPTEADDGTIYDGSREARVACVSGQCTSTFGLDSGETCTSGARECGAGLACCYPCGIPGCDYQCVPACDPGDAGCVDGCIPVP